MNTDLDMWLNCIRGTACMRSLTLSRCVLFCFSSWWWWLQRRSHSSSACYPATQDSRPVFWWDADF